MRTHLRSTVSAALAVAGFLGAVSWFAVGIRSQESNGASRVRGLNGQVLQIHAQLQAGAGARAAALRTEAAALLQQRLASLELLIEENPAEALRLAWPDDIIADLAGTVPGARAQVESRGVWEGPIEYTVEDDPDFRSHRSIREMSVGGETLLIQFAGGEPAGLENGDTLRVVGVRAGKQVVAESGSIVASGSVSTRAKPTPPPPCSTLGAQSAIVLLVTMPGVEPPTDFTPADVEDNFFHVNTGGGDTMLSLNEDWRENSYGVTTTFGAVASGPNGGWYTLDQVYDDTQTSQVRTAAIAAADADVDFRQYRRIFIIVNGLTIVSTTPWAGRGTIGCGQLSSADGSFNASTSWIKSPSMITNERGTFLAAHEGGHNLGLGHSNSREFDTEVLGAPGAAGVADEYNDVFSAMGRHLGHYAAPLKAALGWLPSNVQTITGSGSYLVRPTETPSASIQALRIRRGTDNANWLWVEYRQPVGLYDSRLDYPFTWGGVNEFFYLPSSESHIYSGALIHYEDATTGITSHLLDFTPGSLAGQRSALVADDWFDPALAGTWQDPYTGVSITTSSSTSTSLAVSVSYGSGVCVEANPTVSLSPSNATGKRGQPTTFTVTVTNKDSLPCSGKTFELSSTLPSWVTSFSPSSVTLQAGATATASMTKTVPLNAAYATFDANVFATSGTFTGVGIGNVTVKPGK